MTPRASKSWAVIIAEAVRDALFDLHTGLPGRVESFDSARGTVDVLPLLKRVYQDPDDASEVKEFELPVIPDVPIVYPAGGGWSITFPLEPGDLVYISFAERSLDRWKAADAGSTVDPQLVSLHPLDGAVAIPALRPPTDKLSGLDRGGLRVGKEGGSTEIFIDDNGRVTIKSSDIRFVDENASKSYVLGEDLLQKLNLLLGAFLSHGHTFVGTGSITPGAVPPTIPGLASFDPTLLSQKIKGE